MLTTAYKEALAALQGQAAAVTLMLDDPKAGRQALREAQSRMQLHRIEVQHILRLVTLVGTTVPDLTEAQLAELLQSPPQAKTKPKRGRTR